MLKPTFVAIDFETANSQPHSACAVGIVTVTNGEITDEYHAFIRPHDNEYSYSNIRVHGITPQVTESLPSFHAIYPEIKKRLQGQTVVAHFEAFDRNVLKSAMRMYQLDYDELLLSSPWQCTCRMARQLGLSPANLAACSAREGIALNHHEALSDARACALLYLKYLERSK